MSTSAIGIRLGDAVRTMRVAKRMTILEVAQAVGCSDSHMSLLETGERHFHIDMLFSVADVLHVPPFTLLWMCARGKDRTAYSETLRGLLDAESFHHVFGEGSSHG